MDPDKPFSKNEELLLGFGIMACFCVLSFYLGKRSGFRPPAGFGSPDAATIWIPTKMNHLITDTHGLIFKDTPVGDLILHRN